MITPAQPHFIYQLMLHVQAGDRYGFRLERGQVTGVLSPRSLSQWRRTGLTALEYDADTERVEWAALHLKEFDLTG